MSSLSIFSKAGTWFD